VSLDEHNESKWLNECCIDISGQVWVSVSYFFYLSLCVDLFVCAWSIKNSFSYTSWEVSF
jgi:hypothetical protein